MTRFPSLFLSHGSPTLVIDDVPAAAFLRELGGTLGKPRAIVVASAHHIAAGGVSISAAERPETIHDFGGFPDALYRIRYPAPGAPTVARRAASLLADAGIPADDGNARGMDHGAWVPLSLMYPDADVPVVSLSLVTPLAPERHLAIGRALAPLRDEGVLVIGSGSFTHNLRRLRWVPNDDAAPEWVTSFADWLAGRLLEGDFTATLDYERKHPTARENHPTPEHLTPLFLAMGAGGADAKARRLHTSTTFSALRMDAFAFD
jgi:4,5-DOPA dioxygenase extradiol